MDFLSVIVFLVLPRLFDSAPVLTEELDTGVGEQSSRIVECKLGI